MKRTKTSALIRASLLTGATGVALKMGDCDIQTWRENAVEWLACHGQPCVDLWPWLLVLVLIGFSLFFAGIIGWARAAWFWLSHRRCAPLLAIGGFAIPVSISAIWPNANLVFWISLLPLFAAIAWFFWPVGTREEEPVDQLHRSYFVRRLREIFLTKNTKLRRVAVLGTWGAGKTVILKLLQKELCRVSDIKFRFAFVNPWKAGSPDEAWAILAKGFDQALGFPSPVSQHWGRHPMLARLVKLLPIPSVGEDLFDVFAGDGSHSNQRRVDRINRLLEGRSTRLVLLIDDMERAEPEVIRKMLPVIDRLCELQNCFFVFAIDRDRVAKAFGDDDRARDEALGYLDKVFDLQIDLPAPLEADIGEMCQARLNERDHPKLLGCFADLKPLLPRNPRAAQKFLDLATSKETLFLLRYRDDEHPYLPFFILWMLEAEFPGSIELLLGDDVEKEVGSITEFKLFDTGADEVGSENFKRIEKALVEKHGVANARRVHFLLEALIRNVVRSNGGAWMGKNTFNLRWAAYGHLRLLELSVEERTKLEARWRVKAGAESIQEMLSNEFTDQTFSDINRCAAQLIEMEAERIEHAVRECYGIKDSTEIQARIAWASEATQRLRRHLSFSKEKEHAADLSAFEERFFRSWLESIDRTPLETLGGQNVSDLREERFGLNYDLVQTFPVDRCYHLYRFGVEHIVDRGPQQRAKETRDHVRELRRKLLQRVTNHVFALFREGKIPDDWYENSVTKKGGIEFLYDPQNWLPAAFPEDGLEPLRGLVDEARASATTANSFARLVQELFTEPLSRGFDVDRFDERRSIVQLISNNQEDYIRLLWEGAMSPLVDVDLHERLLRQRSEAIEHGRGEHEPPEGRPERQFFVWDSTVEALFPLSAEGSEPEQGPEEEGSAQ